jgi:MFS family permease
LCSAVLGLIYVAMSTFQAVWQFYIAGAAIGITLAFLLYLSYPTLVNRWFNSRVGFFIGLCSAASGIGGVIFNPLGGYLIAHHGWRNTYLIFGVIILVLVTPLLGLLLRNYPADKGLKPFGENLQQTQTVKAGLLYSDAVKTPIFYTLLVFAFLMISVSTLNLFLPTYITKAGYTVEQSALVASAIMLGVTIGKVALGWLNDRSTLSGVLCSVVLGVIGLILLLLGNAGIAMMVAGGFFFGWAYAGVTVETTLLVRTVFGSKDYAKIFSNVSIALAAGGALMSGGWGYLADYIDFKFILTAGILFLIVSGIIGLYALKVSKKYHTA